MGRGTTCCDTSLTRGSVQQSSGVHIWPFNSSCRVRDARQWHASEASAARLGGRRDKFNTLPSKANKLGAGEPPARTCGFSIDHSRFQRFGCLGTVNVLHKNLVARDDGSVAVASAPPPTLSSMVGDSGRRRVGKIGRIKSLPAFYSVAAGGTDYCVIQRHRIRRVFVLRACP